MAPMKTATRQAFRTEYTYGDRTLVVGRGSPLPPGANPMPNGVNFALICRHGTAVWLVLSEPCEGEVLTEIPSMTCTIEPEITGIFAWTGCRRSFVTVIASMDPRTTGIGLMPGTSCWIPIPERFPAGGHGGQAATCPGAV